MWDQMNTDERLDFYMRMMRGNITLKEYFAVRDRYDYIIWWAINECEARIRDYERATEDGMPLPARWSHNDTPMALVS